MHNHLRAFINFVLFLCGQVVLRLLDELHGGGVLSLEPGSGNQIFERREFIDHDPADVRAVVGSREEVYERIRELKSAMSKKEDEWLREVRQVMAYVTRVVSVKSKEARENAKAAEAIMKER